MKSPRETLLQMTPFLDPHLLLPLVDFAALIDPSLAHLKYGLLSKHTAMIDALSTLHNQLYPGTPLPKSIPAREAIVSDYKRWERALAPLLAALSNESVAQKLSRDHMANASVLKTASENITPQMISDLYDFALLEYSIGQYAEASEKLTHFAVLSSDKNKVNHALWGKLACEILTQNMVSAGEDLFKIVAGIEAEDAAVSHSQKLGQRAWILHWALFVFFNTPKGGREALLDLFFRPAYMNTLQLVCPWLLRYLTVAVLTCSKKSIKDLSKVYSTMSSLDVSKDPLLNFFDAVYVNLDLLRASQALKECPAALQTDFFLVSLLGEFSLAAQSAVFESLLKVHGTLSLEMLATRLCIQSSLETWVTEYITTKGGLDVCLSSDKKTVTFLPRKRGDDPVSLAARIASLQERHDALVATIDSKETLVSS